MVRVPTPLDIHFGEGYVAVVEPRTGIHGAGATEGEAIADFWQAILDFQNSIDPSEDSPDVRRLRVVLDLFLML